MNESGSLSISIAPGRPGEPIRGVVTDSAGIERPFSGWLGLIAAVEAHRVAAERTRTREKGAEKSPPGMHGAVT